LISARCSPLGLGGDIAGSLRIPAEFCGLCALKSTSQRITSGGQAFFSATISGQINIRGTMGPMSRSV
jgi:Asp-tRNA(Asn)/Glu-tRNA(Gln) amidotransferase A subunit family amidase